jgi:hypothetical protein
MAWCNLIEVDWSTSMRLHGAIFQMAVIFRIAVLAKPTDILPVHELEHSGNHCNTEL